MERSVIRFCHCARDIYCLCVPERCPQCDAKLTGRRLDEAPVSIPSPFCNGHKTPCAFLLAPAQGTKLWELDGESDLHTGVTDTHGVVYNYTKTGVRRDSSGWEECLSIPLVQPDMYNLMDQWDRYLEKFSSNLMWDTYCHKFDEATHNCYTYSLNFINCVLATQGKRGLGKDQFTHAFVLPRIKRASKFATLCKEINANRFYAVERKESDDGSAQL